ncbi:MAG: TIGR00375 family protein [Candidatus Altiarchaeota archaeon]|nr:TIGR00375 family protein [Candidatus Altiarchaeota archaeon]
MPELNIDFHIHSKYSKGVSKNMELPVIAEQAQLKGLDMVGTGDALCTPWLSHIKKNLKEDSEGIYRVESSKTGFIVTAEIEDKRRVHHLLLLPSVASAEDLKERLEKHSKDLDMEGRPRINLDGEGLVDVAREVDALTGPAHAFTPWTAVYKEYDTLKECYGSNIKHVKFLELGLSADTHMADRIQELQELTFMTNSDTHSPWPHRLGREFNRVKVKEPDYRNIKEAIERKGDNRFTLNVGLDPREGKYHLTACCKCFLRFRPEDAINVRWRCPECGGTIKKGVADRINELASGDNPRSPHHRPKYVHIIPLAEAIALATGTKTLTGRKISDEWMRLIKKFRTEINILIDADIGEIKKTNPETGRIIERFRADKIRYVAGGGGQYGRPTLDNDEKDNFYGQGQKTLNEF